MDESVSRSEREARRAVLHDALAKLGDGEDADRAAFDVLRALDGYLDAHPTSSASPVAPSREVPVMSGAPTESRQARWAIGLLLAGGVLSTLIVTIAMSGGWPSGLAVAAIWVTILALVLGAS